MVIHDEIDSARPAQIVSGVDLGEGLFTAGLSSVDSEAAARPLLERYRIPRTVKIPAGVFCS